MHKWQADAGGYQVTRLTDSRMVLLIPHLITRTNHAPNKNMSASFERQQPNNI